MRIIACTSDFKVLLHQCRIAPTQRFSSTRAQTLYSKDRINQEGHPSHVHLNAGELVVLETCYSAARRKKVAAKNNPAMVCRLSGLTLSLVELDVSVNVRRNKSTLCAVWDNVEQAEAMMQQRDTIILKIDLFSMQLSSFNTTTDPRQ